MTDRDALLAAVLADPDADAPRLVYADYLEEHGDPDRAKFIRLQCEAARQVPQSKAWWAATLAADRLSGPNEGRWAAHLKGKATRYEFRRGFVEHVTVYAKRFVERGDELFAADPVRAVRFVSLDAERGSVPAVTLFACPRLARLAHLDLSGTALKPADFTKLAASPHARGLRRLTLSSGGGVSILKLLRTLSALTELSFREAGGIDGRKVAALVSDPAFRRVRVLDLFGAAVSGETAGVVAGSRHAAGLEELDLGGWPWELSWHDQTSREPSSDMRWQEVAAIAVSPHLRGLRRLGLGGRRVGDRGAEALAATPTLTRLEWLDLSDAKLSLAGVRALAAAPFAATLRALDLRFNPLAAAEQAEAKRAFPNASVRVSGR